MVLLYYFHFALRFSGAWNVFREPFTYGVPVTPSPRKDDRRTMTSESGDGEAVAADSTDKTSLDSCEEALAAESEGERAGSEPPVDTGHSRDNISMGSFESAGAEFHEDF